METIEIKAFVPAKDFELSKRFYTDLGFSVARYGVRSLPPEDRPWGMRDFVLFDPTGVLWRIGQNIEGRTAA